MERKNPSTAGTVNWEIYKELGYKTKVIHYHYKTFIFSGFIKRANHMPLVRPSRGQSSGLNCHVAQQKSNDISDKCVTSIFRTEELAKQENCNKHMENRAHCLLLLLTLANSLFPKKMETFS
jgi:hypothetical protein